MKLPYSWIKARLDLKLNPQELADLLTSMGVEVDAIEGYAPSCHQVVVAQVLKVKPHPDADRLKVAEVFDGKEHLQIVCGAANCREGIKVALAKIGAKLPGGFEIKKSKIRGVESYGMLCSLEELGYKHASEGICELSEAWDLGNPAIELLNDPVLELSLTPDLGHALSLEGLALLVSAKCGIKFKPQSSPKLEVESSLSCPKIKLETEKCQQYACMSLEGLQVGPSPAWLVNDLTKVGLRSVNNVVDVGNWVMWELGRPVHFFDQDTLKNNLSIRMSHQGEELARIDGVDQKLAKDLLIIADESGPVALAGVMGSRLHELKDTSSRALLEVALFHAGSVRKSAKEAICHSESSRRFERGVTLDNAQAVFERIVELLIKVGHPLRVSSISWNGVLDFEKKKIKLHPEKVKRLLGVELTAHQCQEWLSRLGIEVHLHDKSLDCLIPLSRHDLAIEEDLIDEIMKLIGTDDLPRTQCEASLPGVKHDPQYAFSQSIRHTLVGMGLQEVLTMDFVSSQKIATGLFEGTQLLKVSNPSSSEADVMRPNLLTSMIEVVHHNQAQQLHNLSIFEIGSVYRAQDAAFHDCESQALGILLTGGALFTGSIASRKVDFFDLKGILESLFQSLGVEPTRCVAMEGDQLHAQLHPHVQAAWLDDRSIVMGRLGQLHPAICQELGLAGPIFYAEFSIKDLMQAQKRVHRYQPVAIYPGSSRDWTMTLDQSFSYGKLISLFPKLDYLVDIELVGIWCDEKLGVGRKNVSLRLHYRSDKKTLTQQEVETQHAQLQQIVSGALEKVNLQDARG